MANQKILIVDDDPIILTLLEHDLTGAGYDVVRAEAGQRALRLAQQEQPDLIILDIMMPGMDGGDVAENLASSPGTCNIPIIYLSSLVTPSEEGGGTARTQVVLAKPYVIGKLLAAVRENIRPARVKVF